MTVLDEFLDDVVPRIVEADTALHDGDATRRRAMWSHDDPVTLFGASTSTKGWSRISRVFDQLEANLSDCTAYDCHVVAAGVRKAVHRHGDHGPESSLTWLVEDL